MVRRARRGGAFLAGQHLHAYRSGAPFRCSRRDADVFVSGREAQAAPCTRAASATQEQVERWANADSNGFMFLLIERGPKIIRQIRTLGVTEDFREELADAWLSVQHPVDMQKAQTIIAGMNDQAVINAAVLWAYNPKTDLYERKKSRSAVM